MKTLTLTNLFPFAFDFVRQIAGVPGLVVSTKRGRRTYGVVGFGDVFIPISFLCLVFLPPDMSVRRVLFFQIFLAGAERKEARTETNISYLLCLTFPNDSCKFSSPFFIPLLESYTILYTRCCVLLFRRTALSTRYLQYHYRSEYIISPPLLVILLSSLFPNIFPRMNVPCLSYPLFIAPPFSRPNKLSLGGFAYILFAQP